MQAKIDNNQTLANNRKPETWDEFFAVLKDTNVPADFLNEKERGQDREKLDI